jgi:hypothetical protein
MLCYKDRSYCSASDDCHRTVCNYQITQLEKNKANELSLPICRANYRDTDDCPGFIGKTELDAALDVVRDAGYDCRDPFDY